MEAVVWSTNKMQLTGTLIICCKLEVSSKTKLEQQNDVGGSSCRITNSFCRQEQRNMHVEHALFLRPLQLCCSR